MGTKQKKEGQRREREGGGGGISPQEKGEMDRSW